MYTADVPKNKTILPLLADPIDRSLSFIWLELTSKCNLECVHCYADALPSLPLQESMRLADWQRLMAEARMLHCEGVQFIGGEVLLVPYLEELVLHAREIGFESIEVFTNATLVGDRYIELFEKHSVRVATSFYSFDPDTHDRITKRRGSWKKTLSAMERLQSSGIPIRVGVIAMEDNKDHVADTLSFLENLGISSVGVDEMRSIGRANNLRSCENQLAELCGQCGNKRICVTATGDIYPCIMARHAKLGNYLEAVSLEGAIAWNDLGIFRSELLAVKGEEALVEGGLYKMACTPHCWPHGGCAPHDICQPDKKK